MAPPAEPSGSGSALLKAGLLLAGLAMAGWVAQGWGASGWGASGWGASGWGINFLRGAPATARNAAVLVGVGGLLAAIGVPRQAVAFAGGYAFGAWVGGGLSLAAQLAGCVADFWWARLVAQDWARRCLRGRLARAERFLTARPFAATLTLRLLPVGNNLALNLVAGVSDVRAGPFLAASALGYLPQTAVFALAGSGVHVDRSLQLLLSAVLFGLSGLLGWRLLRSAAGPKARGFAP